MFVSARWESVRRRRLPVAATWLAMGFMLAAANQAAFGSLTAMLAATVPFPSAPSPSAPSPGSPSEQEEKPLEEADPSSPCAKLASERKRAHHLKQVLFGGERQQQSIAALGRSQRWPASVHRDGPLFPPASHGGGLPLLC